MIPPFAIGSDVLPGAAKVIEEAGEVLQVLGKRMAFPDSPHPDGTDLDQLTIEELGDLKAAIDYFAEQQGIENEVAERRRYKITRMRTWHDAHRAGVT